MYFIKWLSQKVCRKVQSIVCVIPSFFEGLVDKYDDTDGIDAFILMLLLMAGGSSPGVFASVLIWGKGNNTHTFAQYATVFGVPVVIFLTFILLFFLSLYRDFKREQEKIIDILSK